MERTSLTDGIYRAMDLEIEQCPADVTIYNNFAKYYRRSEESKAVFKVMNSAIICG